MKILVGIEDKTFGKAIIDFIKSYKWPAKSTFRLIHILEPTVHTLSLYTKDLIENINEERTRAAKSLLLTMHNQLAQDFFKINNSDMGIENFLLEGEPKVEILKQATDWEADLIILGSHGKNNFQQFFLGSVSMSVLSVSPCSVLIIKCTKENDSSNTKDADRVNDINQKDSDKKKANLLV